MRRRRKPKAGKKQKSRILESLYKPKKRESGEKKPADLTDGQSVQMTLNQANDAVDSILGEMGSIVKRGLKYKIRIRGASLELSTGYEDKNEGCSDGCTTEDGTSAEKEEVTGVPNEVKAIFVSRALERYLREQSTDKAVILEDLNVMEREYHMSKIKWQRFYDILTMVLSMLYAIFLFFSALCCYFSDIFVMLDLQLSECFNIYLSGVGLAWMIFLQIDIGNYTKKLKGYWRQQKKDLMKLPLTRKDDGTVELQVTGRESKKMKKALPDTYLFSTDRHNRSYFLKIGAGFFCLGHIVHFTCILARDGSYYFVPEDKYHCFEPLKIVYTIIHIAYSCAMITIIFEFSNIIVNQRRGTAKFAFMHCVSGCLCLWAHLILTENYDSMVEKRIGAKRSSLIWSCLERMQNITDVEKAPSAFDVVIAKSFDDCDKFLKFNHTCYVTKAFLCYDGNEVAHKISNFIPFLYPFSIQFNILIVGIWWTMWHNVGNMATHGESNFMFVPEKIDPEINYRRRPAKALITRGDCATSSKGMILASGFSGFTTVCMVVFIILRNSSSCLKQEYGTYLADGMNSLILFIMLLATLRLYVKVSDFEVNSNPIEFLDDLLLFVCIPAFFVLAFTNASPNLLDLNKAMTKFGIGTVVTNFLELVQVVIQTPLICDGLRRCSEDVERQKKKPGRSHITFLLLGNLILYGWGTMRLKTGELEYGAIEFYGEFIFGTVRHFCTPLLLFFRFHSAVALSDMWNSLYKPGDHEETAANVGQEKR